MRNVIGLDLGTTHCKAVRVDDTGKVLASATREVAMRTPRPGYAEQNAQEVWAAAQAVLAEVGCSEAIVLSAAMHSVLPVDGNGSPLAPAMTWADQRCEPQWREIDVECRGLYPRTGCPSHTTYHPARLRWLLEHHGEASRFVSLRDYVLFKLTGTWACDIGMASTTGLLDIHGRHWCDEALALARVQLDRLCPLVAPEALIGTWRGMKVIAGTSDGALANLGAPGSPGSSTPGNTVITIGTSAAIRRVSMQPVLDAGQRTWCYCFPDNLYLSGGAINNAGLLLKWLRQTMYRDVTADDPYAVIVQEAATVAPGADELTLLPYLTGERCPHYRSDLRGSLHGLTLEHTRSHIARAALEAVAFCLRDVWECLPPPPEGTADVIRLTGGVTRYPAWMQIVADVLGTALEPVDAADASALGAALLGHRTLGYVAPDATWIQPTGRLVEPNTATHDAYEQAYAKFKSRQREVLDSD